MAGYTRQSTASIINGENITAPPLTAEFNQLAAAFNLSSGHSHDGTTGNAPKIELSTSVSGYLPAINGGLGGRNNFAATRVPGAGDDTADGYAVGSAWYFVNDDRYFVCMYAASGAAVWLENRFIDTNGDFRPHANNTDDLGSSTKRWRDLFLHRNADIDGTLNVASTTYLGGAVTIAANADFTTGTTTINSIDVASGALDSTTIGITNAAAGVFTTLEATTSLAAATADINGGSIDGATVGANSHSTGKFTTLQSTGLATLNSVNIDGGAIDGAVIGASTAAAGSFSTISTTGQATLASADINGGSIDGATIGANSASTITGTTITGTSLVGPVTGNVTGNTSGTHTGPVTGAVTGNLTGNVTSSGTSTFNNVTIDGTLNMNAGTSATITNLSAPTNANDAARKVDVDNAVANLVDSAPGTLDTLNELAAALGDDPDFATTITNSIATKLPLAGGTMTGAIAMSTNKITGVGDPTAAQDVSSKAYVDQQDALQVTKAGDSMSGNLAMGSNNITGLATPTANDHAVNKSYADNILGSATAAATSASNAATSESNAATSETNASNSATAAASSATSAAASLDSFDDRYLGAKSSAPSLDNDGDALIVGALYFDSTAGAMKVYSANGWTNAGSSVNGTTNRYSYTATAGQTVFAATYDSGFVDIFLNGVKQLVGTDVTATSGTSVVFASGTTVNDIVEIVGYGTFVLADHLTQTQSDARYVNLSGDTMTGNLDITGTLTSDGLTVDGVPTTIDDNRIIFNETPAAGSLGSRIVWRNPSTTYDYASIGFDNQAGSSGGLRFKTASSVFSDTDKLRMDIAGNGDISFYEDTGSTPKFFWSAADERLGIGTTLPSQQLTLANNSSSKIQIKGHSASNGFFLGMDSATAVQLWNAENGFMRFATNDSERMRLGSDGTVLVGRTAEGDSNVGHTFRQDGFSQTTRSGGLVADFNRLSSDGDICRFQKDGAPVGSIGSRSSAIYIGRGDTGISFTDNDDAVYPVSPSGLAIRDAAIDLGISNVRFKDLYLSGGVFLGGTGSANKLDRYEEGTWNLTCTAFTATSSNAFYRVIGDVCYAWFNVVGVSNVNSNAVRISLPFTSAYGAGFGSAGSVFANFNNLSPTSCWVGNSASVVDFYNSVSTNSQYTQFAGGNISNASSFAMYGQFQYRIP